MRTVGLQVKKEAAAEKAVPRKTVKRQSASGKTK